MTDDVIAGRFALCDPIGSGGSGTVWRAFDHKMLRYCAAKLLRQRDAGDLLRFVREQSVRLDHPHIVSPYSWVAEDDTVLIASELMTGGSLHTLIGDFGPLAESTVSTVLRQVLAGLQAVHDAELIHRDVKPANLLLSATGTAPMHVVLADFGLTISRRDARLTQVGMVIGTPGYLPPEVLLGRVSPDPRHDLYAAGQLALTMIAGAENIGSEADLIESIADPALRRTVDALLRHDPAERPADASAAAALLAGQLGIGAAADREPRTRDGDLIEVLNQLPPLPPGWSPQGPMVVAVPAPRATARATIVDVALTAPTAMGDDLRPEKAQTEVTPVVPAPIVDGPGHLPSDLSDGDLRAGDRSRRRPVVIGLGVAAVLAAGLVVGLQVLPTTGGDPGEPPTSTVSSPAVTPGTSAPPQTAGSTGTPGSIGTTGSTGTAGSTRATSRISPTATASATPATLRAGDGCTWQQEGDRQVGVEGAALVCSLIDGVYQWRPSG